MKIGDLELGNLPVSVGTVCTDLNMPVDSIEKIDILEIRVDMLEATDSSDILKIINSIKQRYAKPVIGTIRSITEGGSRQIDDETRYELFKEIVHVVDILDVELSSTNLLSKVALLCKDNNKKLMVSYHNFDATPHADALKEIVCKGKEVGASFIKVAVQANNKSDLGDLIKFTIENKESNIITISLGNIGLASRLITPLVGSLMTYGYVDSVASPGQISIFDIIEYIRLLDPAYNDALIERIKLLEAI